MKVIFIIATVLSISLPYLSKAQSTTTELGIFIDQIQCEYNPTDTIQSSIIEVIIKENVWRAKVKLIVTNENKDSVNFRFYDRYDNFFLVQKDGNVSKGEIEKWRGPGGVMLPLGESTSYSLLFNLLGKVNFTSDKQLENFLDGCFIRYLRNYGDCEEEYLIPINKDEVMFTLVN